jgi:hypothetical protein
MRNLRNEDRYGMIGIQETWRNATVIFQSTQRECETLSSIVSKERKMRMSEKSADENIWS